MSDSKSNDSSVHDSKGKLLSQELAALLVDALIDAGFLPKDLAEKAIEVLIEEIDTRKHLGDY